MDKHFLHCLTNTWPNKRLLTLSMLGICMLSSAFTSDIAKDKPNSKTSSTKKEAKLHKPSKPVAKTKATLPYQVTAVPTVSTLSPTRNKNNAPRNSAVAITFSEAMNAATSSSNAIKVRGSMTGSLAGTFAGAGTSTTTFTPTKSFRSGETVSVSILATAQNSGGTTIKPHLHSFIAASAVAPATFPDAPKILTALTFPHALFVADINGDGHLDIATANAGSNKVSLQKNDGAGNFTPGTAVTVGLGPESIFMADFDGDGDVDMATANMMGSSVSIRKNDGTGSFSGATDISTKIDGEASQSNSVYGADFDGDGDIDLATADINSQAASILTNDGAGNFTITATVGVGFFPVAITAADLDNDGDIDLASTSSLLNSITILKNDGTGTFTFDSETTVGTYPISICAADFNGDGRIDLATANRDAASVSIQVNNLDGSFSNSSTISVGLKPQTVHAGDIDGDGDLDIVTANATDNNVSTRLNNGTGTFSGTTNIATGKTGAYSVQLADIDGDNTLDMCVANNNTGVSVIQNKPPVTANNPPTISTATNQAACNGTALATISFTVGDAETAAGSLTVAGSSSNTTLLPNANIVFGGSGANRTVALTPATGQTGTATITLTVDDTAGKTTTSTFTLTVNATPSISIAAPTAICAPATVDLTQLAITDANSTTGTLTYWKDAAATTAFATPTTAPAGTYYIKKTTAAGCSDIKSVVVTVNAAPTVVAGTAQSVCADATAFTLTGFSPAGGTWTGSGVSASGTFTPSAGLVGTQTLTYTATQNGCTASATKTITVKALPTVVAGTAQSVCSDAAAFSLSGFSPAGGTWTGSGVSASGTFTPSASLVGTQTLTYTATANGCSASATKTITVTAPPTVKAGADQTVCADVTTVTLTGFSPAGGTWSGTGVTAAGVFSTSAGTQTLTYTATQTGCTSSATKKVTVAPTIVFTIKATANNSCTSPNGSIEVVTTSGGMLLYSLNNITFQASPIFNGLSAGAYNVYIKGDNCTAQTTTTLGGPNAPTAFAVTGGGMGCTGDTGFKVGLANSEVGVTYQLLLGATPQGSMVAGTGNALDFGVQATAGTYTISAANVANCKNTMTGSATIAFTAIPSISITAPATVCALATVDLTQLTITDANSTSGTLSYWKDAAATTAFATPTTAPTGTYYIKKTTAAGCSDIKSVVVTENAAPTVVAGTAQSVCADAAAFQLTGFSPVDGTWTGSGVSASGTFTPNASLVGDQTLTYTVTENGCSASATKIVTVKGIPTGLVASASTAVLGESLNLNATTIANATYQWTGPDSFTSTEQNPVIAAMTTSKAGKYTVMATVNGCSSVGAEVSVTVQAAPTVTLSMPALSGQPASQVVVPVRVKDFKKIVSLQGSIVWDKAVATFTKVEAFGLPGMTADDFGGSNQTDAGILSFSWFESTEPSRTLADSTVIFSIRFTLVGNEGTSTAVSFSDTPTLIEVSNEAGKVVETITKPGSIQVAAVVKVAGAVKSTSGKAIKSVGLTINDGTTSQNVDADATGAYQFTVDAGTNFTVKPFKNNSISAMNGISTLDLILIQRHILNKTLLDSPYKIIAADVNNDKTITTLDIVQIRSLILTSTTSLPGNRQWAFVRSDFQFDATAPFQYDSTRMYTSASQVTAQDFIGIRLGDVNESWDANVARVATAGDVQFSINDQQALAATEIVVPVKVSSFDAVRGYQFTLNWNPAVLEFKEVQKGALAATYGLNQAQQGRLTTSWQHAQGSSLSLPDDSTVFSIRFKVIGKAGSTTNVSINSSLTASEAYNSDFAHLNILSTDTQVEVVDAISETEYGYTLEQNQPNPFSTTTAIWFYIPKEENVSLSIYNNLGQLVATMDGRYQKGKHRIEWNGKNQNGHQAAPGTYFYRLQSGKFVDVKKAIVLE